MPRAARIFKEEGIFHILTRGNNRQKIFHDSSDYQNYIEILRRYKREHDCLFYHYCLMPNHVHLIVEVTYNTDLSRLMKQINLSYFNYYRNKYKYHGHFWQDRFKSLLISRDEYLINCARYIEANPVKANIVNNPEKYKWSSYNVYAYGKNDRLTDLNPLYGDMGETNQERQGLYRRQEAPEGLEINFNALFYGPQSFIETMENKFNIKNRRGKRGRSSKE